MHKSLLGWKSFFRNRLNFQGPFIDKPDGLFGLARKVPVLFRQQYLQLRVHQQGGPFDLSMKPRYGLRQFPEIALTLVLLP